MNYTTIVMSGLLCTIPYKQDFDCNVDPKDDDDKDDDDKDDDDKDDDDKDELYWAEGPQVNVPVEDLVGWSECFANLYSESEPGLTQDILGQDCTGSKLLMACRPVGADTFQLLAMGERADVLFDTGAQPNGTHEANGVAWYFSADFSWGFAAAGDAVNRSTCDSVGNGPETNSDLRLCWHTGSDQIRGGWRCGDDDLLNDSNAFERFIFEAD
ncbi:hypothetical protein [Nannocystis punicea]|uniref:Uncharacterized protein n=1 Tax=Nannocystis punicea TaxID=2995304 RepID=A0ABY7HA35_9BACT|nr:hypothetical protein [Nannocystis poenicansa]WAS96003.1 hypothetical protein O0S08_07540 [Nannocystis poenicansa]